MKRRIWIGAALALAAAAGGTILMLNGMSVTDEESGAESSALVVYYEETAFSKEAAAAGTSAEKTEEPAGQGTTAVTTAVTTTKTPVTTTRVSRTTSSRIRQQGNTVQRIEPEIIVTLPLELNAATVEELMVLPEIGRALAERIVAYRDAIGGFLNREQLLEVNGIGEQRLDAIWDLIYLEYEVYPEEELPPELWEEYPPEEPDLPPEEIPILDVNTATAEDFEKLPGVDAELAQKMVELRELIGPFENPLELLYTEGMSDELYLSIEKYLTLG